RRRPPCDHTPAVRLQACHSRRPHVKLTTSLVIPVAALLVAVGAGAVLASTGSSPSTSGSAGVVPAADQPSASPAAAPTASPPPGAPRRAFQDPLLTQVLDDLVAKGTITADQRQAILDGLQSARQAKIDEARQRAEQLRQFLADGQITQDELNQLPADSPLRQLSNLMADGTIPVDELRSIGRGFLRGVDGVGRLRPFVRGFGPLGPKAAPSASPSPSAGTGGRPAGPRPQPPPQTARPFPANPPPPPRTRAAPLLRRRRAAPHPPRA